METNSSRLTLKHILITLFLYVVIPSLAKVTNHFVQQEYISLMFAINILVSLMTFYNWNLLAIHGNRFKKLSEDTILYTVLGTAFIAFWLWIGRGFLHAQLLLPDHIYIVGYGYARIGMLIAFSLMQALAVNIGFKVFTERLNVVGKEVESILLSGLAFGFLTTLLFTPFDISLLARTYLYNVILTTVLSYLYNQTHSILPGIISMTLVYLATMIIPFF